MTAQDKAAHRPRPAAAGGAVSAPWLMLLALCAAFLMSNVYRTAAAILAPELQARWGYTPQQLGVFAAAFHFAFGVPQFVMGVGIDLYGLRRTVLAVFPLTVLGALLSAFSVDYPVLVLGQVLIGIGCAPAFVVCTVFIARRFEARRFAAVSGTALAFGSLGMLLTGTPLAWLVQAHSVQTAFGVMAALSALAWVVVYAVVREPPLPASETRTVGLWPALCEFGRLLRLPQTLGIMALGSVVYAAFITLRGLWLGPMLVARYGYSLLESGHVALAVSVVALLGPPVFGRLDPGPRTRRRWLVAGTLLMAALFVGLTFAQAPWAGGALLLLIGSVSGYAVLQYADVRAAYPESQTGRALAAFTMAMFLGIALMQWLTGLVAQAAKGAGLDPYAAVLWAIALMLVLGAAMFAWLPAHNEGRPAAPVSGS